MQSFNGATNYCQLCSASSHRAATGSDLTTKPHTELQLAPGAMASSVCCLDVLQPGSGVRQPGWPEARLGLAADEGEIGDDCD